MDNNNLKNEIVKAAMNIQCYDNFDKVELAKNSTVLPIANIASLGAGFSSIAPFFHTVTQTIETANTSNLYQCIFPNGVSGTLAQFKDGSGNMGTIIDKNGIVGQARWIKPDSIPQTIKTQMPLDPATMCMAVAMMNLNKKLDSITSTQQLLVESIEQERKSQLLADLNILAEIAGEYKYYWDNDNHLTSSLTQVKEIKRNSKKELISYREKIENSLDKKHFNMLGSNSALRIEKMANNLIHFKLALYNQSYSSYMQIMLTKNFEPELLQKLVAEIEEASYQYRELYTDCYNFIESVTGNSIEKYISKGASKITKLAGNTVAKMPRLSKTEIDEILIDSSEKIEQREAERIAKTMDLFIRHKESGIKTFSDNIKTIDKIYNSKIRMFFDNENIYLINES